MKYKKRKRKKVSLTGRREREANNRQHRIRRSDPDVRDKEREAKKLYRQNARLEARQNAKNMQI